MGRAVPRRGGFNEAAANGRGNSARIGREQVRRRASMRPRRMAAEMAAAEENTLAVYELQ